MLVSGGGSASWLGHSLSEALTRAADGTPPAARAAFQSLSIEQDPLSADIALYGVPETGGFQDRTVTTTVDEIELKIDVARVTKGGSDTAGARGDAATETVRIRVETTVDPLTGQRDARHQRPASDNERRARRQGARSDRRRAGGRPRRLARRGVARRSPHDHAYLLPNAVGEGPGRPGTKLSRSRPTRARSTSPIPLKRRSPSTPRKHRSRRLPRSRSGSRTSIQRKDRSRRASPA